jgi:ABC-type uncharacterized transport system involved in gliding motility auxiliary subunit
MARKTKNSTPRYAIAGIIIAVIACIAAGLIGAARAMMAMQLVPGQNAETLDRPLWISAGLIVLGLAAYAMMAPDAVRRFMSGRQARYGSNSLILALAFAGILIVANVLAFQNPDFLGAPWDLTEDRSNTLSPETLQALATLPDEVMATAFFSQSLDPSSAEQLLRQFETKSNKKFEYQFVNPDTDPLAARQAGITGDGKILLQMGENQEIASFASETELTRALIRLISPEERVLYFLEGHGEGEIEPGAQAEGAFTNASQTLESKNYTVNTINLLADTTIPDDALAIIIAGPKKPLSEEEVSLLQDYVDAGGSLVIMEDPTFATEFGESADPLANYLAQDWNITLNNDVIFDLATSTPINAISIYKNQHPITQNLTENYSVIMPQARSISIPDVAPENITLTWLIQTSQQSWGETGLDAESTEDLKYDEGLDILGPLNMAVVGENATTKGRVVVFGNSIFASDDGFDVLGNGNMFINSVDWAAEQEDLINITPREQTTRTLQPIGNLQFIIMVLLAIIVLPGAIIFMGISSWIARRRRG